MISIVLLGSGLFTVHLLRNTSAVENSRKAVGSKTLLFEHRRILIPLILFVAYFYSVNNFPLIDVSRSTNRTLYHSPWVLWFIDFLIVAYLAYEARPYFLRERIPLRRLPLKQLAYFVFLAGPLALAEIHSRYVLVDDQRFEASSLIFSLSSNRSFDFEDIKLIEHRIDEFDEEVLRFSQRESDRINDIDVEPLVRHALPELKRQAIDHGISFRVHGLSLSQ